MSIVSEQFKKIFQEPEKFNSASTLAEKAQN